MNLFNSDVSVRKHTHTHTHKHTQMRTRRTYLFTMLGASLDVCCGGGVYLRLKQKEAISRTSKASCSG